MDGVTPDDDFGPFPGRAKLLSDQNFVCSRVFVFINCNHTKYNHSVLSLSLLDTSAYYHICSQFPMAEINKTYYKHLQKIVLSYY